MIHLSYNFGLTVRAHTVRASAVLPNTMGLMQQRYICNQTTFAPIMLLHLSRNCLKFAFVTIACLHIPCFCIFCALCRHCSFKHCLNELCSPEYCSAEHYPRLRSLTFPDFSPLPRVNLFPDLFFLPTWHANSPSKFRANPSNRSAF